MVKFKHVFPLATSRYEFTESNSHAHKLIYSCLNRWTGSLSFLPICFNTQRSAQTYFWSVSEKRKTNRRTPLKRLFGLECAVADECRKQRSAHIENTHGNNCSCGVRQKSKDIWCREQKQSSLVRTLERGKWPMASTLILVATSTAEVAQNAHKALCKVVVATAEALNNRANTFTCRCRSIPPPSTTLPFYWVWSVSTLADQQCREARSKHRKVHIHIHLLPPPPLRLFIESGQRAGNRSHWCKVSSVSIR